MGNLAQPDMRICLKTEFHKLTSNHDVTEIKDIIPKTS